MTYRCQGRQYLVISAGGHGKNGTKTLLRGERLDRHTTMDACTFVAE